jgi:hypothetical protein
MLGCVVMIYGMNTDRGAIGKIATLGIELCSAETFWRRCLFVTFALVMGRTVTMSTSESAFAMARRQMRPTLDILDVTSNYVQDVQGPNH